MNQGLLFGDTDAPPGAFGPSRPPEEPRFDGATFSPEHDEARLSQQHRRVFDLMRDGAWRSPAEITAATGDDWASASARLRDCRKAKFGGHAVERRRRGEASRGLFEYRLVVNEGERRAEPSTSIGRE